MEHHKGKHKIIITFAILFMSVLLLLALVFFAGKKTYVVRFDLNGGTLISGSLEQHITQGQDAVPPAVVKDGAYLRGWSASYRQITKDIVIRAIWEYETTTGIIYSNSQNQNFAEIIGSYEHLRGEVYLGAYYGDKKILGICERAFADRKGITRFYLLDGLLSIEKEAFSGCTALTEIEIPRTVTHLGEGAFRGCESLERIVLNEGLLEIGEGAFDGCVNLKEIILPASLIKIGTNAFADCDDLVITVTHAEGKNYDQWADGWQGSATVEWPDGVLVEGPESEESDSETSDLEETGTEETETEELKRPGHKFEIDFGDIKFPFPGFQINPEETKKPSSDIELEPDDIKRPSLDIEIDTKPSLDTDAETESDTSDTSETEE